MVDLKNISIFRYIKQLKKFNMKKTTTNPTYPSYKSSDLVNHLNESGTGTLSQTFNPNFTTQSKPQS